MGAEDGDGIRRDLREVFHEYRAFALKAFNNVFIVNDLVAHVHGWAIFFQRAFHDLDCANHTGAKPAGLRQKNFQGTTIKHVAPRSLPFSSELFPSDRQKFAPRPFLKIAPIHRPHDLTSLVYAPPATGL